MAHRLDWDRAGDGTARTHTCGLRATVRRDDTITPAFMWEVVGAENDRYTAMERAEKAALAAIATGRTAPDWVAELMRMASAGEAYLTVGGVRDTHTLPLLCKLALDGAAGPQVAVVEKRKGKS